MILFVLRHLIQFFGSVNVKKRMQDKCFESQTFIYLYFFIYISSSNLMKRPSMVLHGTVVYFECTRSSAPQRLQCHLVLYWRPVRHMSLPFVSDSSPKCSIWTRNTHRLIALFDCHVWSQMDKQVTKIKLEVQRKRRDGDRTREERGWISNSLSVDAALGVLTLALISD